MLDWGFDRCEANHNGISVEEIPEKNRAALEAEGKLKHYQYLKLWNEQHCEASVYLAGAFEQSTPLYGTLSHSHLLLVLLCWSTGAKWELKDKKKAPRFCDKDGRLDAAAVAEYANATEMLTVMREGIDMEVLAWEMNVE